MTFIWMDMLWLLLLVPLLIGAYIWLLRRRKKSALRYANLALVKQAMGKGVGWRRHVPPALLLASITVLIFAVARPAAVVELASSRATVILSMDVSGSMRARDVEPSRIVAAQEAAKAPRLRGGTGSLGGRGPGLSTGSRCASDVPNRPLGSNHVCRVRRELLLRLPAGRPRGR